MTYKNKTKEGVEVEITVSENAIKSNFKEGTPTDFEMILTDNNKEQYQADVFLKKGWTFGELQEIITTTMLSCDSSIISVKSTIKGIVSQN